MNQHTIEIRVNGTDREVTLTQPLGFEYMHTAATMPEEVSAAAITGEEPEMSPEVIDWLQTLTRRVTDLSDDELNAVKPEDMNRLIEASTLVFAGDAPPKKGSDYRLDQPDTQSDDPFDGLDLNDDGTLGGDGEDWR